jgi:hypothetical protein
MAIIVQGLLDVLFDENFVILKILQLITLNIENILLFSEMIEQ